MNVHECVKFISDSVDRSSDELKSREDWFVLWESIVELSLFVDFIIDYDLQKQKQSAQKKREI
ncbi:hypothetical protein DAMA08_005940 [Martiniozyma asiatica (nom. inval.)]|nr:hypothetical protein DAMA08_005940 [Martiniozyma asiatica]